MGATWGYPQLLGTESQGKNSPEAPKGPKSPEARKGPERSHMACEGGETRMAVLP